MSYRDGPPAKRLRSRSGAEAIVEPSAAAADTADAHLPNDPYGREITTLLLRDEDRHAELPILSARLEYERAECLRWVFHCSRMLRLQHTTVHLAVATLDRVLVARCPPAQKMKLVCAACLLTAAKYEECANEIPWPLCEMLVNMAGKTVRVSSG